MFGALRPDQPLAGAICRAALRRATGSASASVLAVLMTRSIQRGFDFMGFPFTDVRGTGISALDKQTFADH